MPDIEFGYWDETIERWHNEGLPKSVTNISQVEKHLGIEQILSVPNACLDINITEKKILEDKGDTVIEQDALGTIYERGKHGATIPRYIKYPNRNTTRLGEVQGKV